LVQIIFHLDPRCPETSTSSQSGSGYGSGSNPETD